MERGWIWARGKVCEGSQEKWREGKLVRKDCKREESFFNNKKIIQKNVSPKRFYTVLI